MSRTGSRGDRDCWFLDLDRCVSMARTAGRVAPRTRPIGRDVLFDDERVVVNAGIVLAVALGRRLGIEARVDGAVRRWPVRGGRAPGRARRGWRSTSTASSPRSTGTPSRALATGTLASSATTRLLATARIPARSCTSASGGRQEVGSRVEQFEQIRRDRAVQCKTWVAFVRFAWAIHV